MVAKRLRFRLATRDQAEHTPSKSWSEFEILFNPKVGGRFWPLDSYSDLKPERGINFGIHQPKAWNWTYLDVSQCLSLSLSLSIQKWMSVLLNNRRLSLSLFPTGNPTAFFPSSMLSSSCLVFYSGENDGDHDDDDDGGGDVGGEKERRAQTRGMLSLSNNGIRPRWLKLFGLEFWSL